MEAFNKYQSDIINYRPNLKIDTVPSINALFEDKTSSKIEIPLIADNRSISLIEFELFLPSKTLMDFENSINTIDVYKEILESKMKSTRNGLKYLSEIDEIKKQNIIVSNSNDISGTTYLESIIELNKIRDELESIRKEYCNNTYGEDLEGSEAKKIDNSFIEKISLLELDGDDSDVNYTNLYYETMISKILKEYNDDLLDIGITGIGSINDFCEESPFDEKYTNMLLNNFNKKNENLKSDILKDKCTSTKIITSLKNTFITLKNYEDSIDAIDNSNLIFENTELADEIKRDNLYSLNNSFDDLINTTKYSVISKGDIADSLIKKSAIRWYFIEQ